MAIVDLVVFGLTVLTLPFAIIELGLTGYFVSEIDSYFGGYLRGSALSTRADFLLFASIWTILIAILLLAFPLCFGRSGSSPGWASPVTVGLNTLTMIFWLAGFAAWADLPRIGSASGIDGGILAFAVMLWLIFLGLTALSFLTAFNIVRSERFGYGSVAKKSTVP